MGIPTMNLLLAFLVLTLVLNGCDKGQPGSPSLQGKVVPAHVETVRSRRLPVYAVLPGTVVSADRVEVSSRLTGYLYDLDVHEGQHVKKGQLLFAVDPTGVKAEIRRAKAELEKALATLDDASANYKRYKKLFSGRATTRQEFDAVERAWKVAQGNYQAAQAALATARAQLKYAEVRSPFDGLVVAKRADKGQLASPGVPVLILENPNHLQVQLQVPEQAFVHLTLGQEIPIRFEGADFRMHRMTGPVERLVAAADPVTHTHLVKIGLPLRSRSFSGEYALVDVPLGEQEGIVVPSGAVHTRAGITGVFVVDAADRARFRMVTPGQQMNGGQVILSGLFPGDRIIVSAQGPLANGVKIRVQPEGDS
jgi:multidrug efflux system membrane fusion protein